MSSSYQNGEEVEEGKVSIHYRVESEEMFLKNFDL